MWKLKRGTLTQAASLCVPVGGGNSPGGGGGDSPAPDSPGGDSPGAFEWPDATNTGVPAGTTLTASGSITVNTNNTTVQDKLVTGLIVLNGSNCIVKNCKVLAGGIESWDPSNTVQDCEVDGQTAPGAAQNGIFGIGIIQRCNVHNHENGIVIGGSNTNVLYNYIHDLTTFNEDAHFDGIACHGGDGGASGIVISDNFVWSHDTSCIFIKNNFGPIDDVSIHHNYLTGNPSYNIYVDGRSTGGPITNVTITDNVIDVDMVTYGPFSIDDASPTVSGNVDPNGDPVT